MEDSRWKTGVARWGAKRLLFGRERSGVALLDRDRLGACECRCFFRSRDFTVEVTSTRFYRSGIEVECNPAEMTPAAQRDGNPQTLVS